MRFDTFTMVLLELNPDRPKLDADATAALQDAHMSYLADLHDRGALLACGPLLGAADRSLHGLSLFASDVETALQLCESDPAVIAGRYLVVALPWAVPGGAMSFRHTRLPRSMADLDDE